MSAFVETIFAHAAALQQSGRMKNTIYAKNHTVFILNTDKTILLRFSIPAREPDFREIAFAANDYESFDMKIEDGRMKFTTVSGSYRREKTCSSVEKTFGEVEKLYQAYLDDDVKNKHNNTISLDSSIVQLLDEGLSHIEIYSENLSPVIVQKDIYSGATIKITKKEDLGFNLNADNLKSDFGPVGIRTNDLLALFMFHDELKLYFTEDNTPADYCLILADKFSMQGVLSHCVYDEMGKVSTSKEDSNGRQKSKRRNDEQAADQADNESTDKPESETPKRRRRT